MNLSRVIVFSVLTFFFLLILIRTKEEIRDDKGEEYDVRVENGIRTRLKERRKKKKISKKNIEKIQMQKKKRK